MIVIKNKYFPFGGYKAMTVWPFIFTKSELSNVDLNHEKIHGVQQIELLIIPFFIIDLIEWIFRGYKNISFEKEAYKHQGDLEYLKTRKHYAQWRNDN